MDASKRFLIEQPTGGELTEFIRLVELQAAAAHAGAFLAECARLLHEAAAVRGWEELRERFRAKTQQLWRDGWFHDFDARAGQLVTRLPPDPAQSAPAFCGVATTQQLGEMRRTLRQFYEISRSRKLPAEGWDDGLAWSSIVLPYLESVWTAGDGELAANIVHTLADRIYTSMDRRAVTVASGKGAPQLGWPGVSCEIWGAHGAFGGEGYGWGAVMPAHIIRSLVGVRETAAAENFHLCPNLPDPFMTAGRRYGITRVRCGGVEILALGYRVIDHNKLLVSADLPSGVSIRSVLGGDNRERLIQRDGQMWRFDAANHERCSVHLSTTAS